jgi:hypothetical protein
MLWETLGKPWMCSCQANSIIQPFICSPCSPFVKGECIHGIGKGEFGLNYMPACASGHFYAKNSHAPGHNVLSMYRKYWSWA